MISQVFIKKEQSPVQASGKTKKQRRTTSKVAVVKTEPFTTKEEALPSGKAIGAVNKGSKRKRGETVRDSDSLQGATDLGLAPNAVKVPALLMKLRMDVPSGFKMLCYQHHLVLTGEECSVGNQSSCGNMSQLSCQQIAWTHK